MTSRSSTPERDALRDMVDGFTRKEIVPHLADWERAGEIPRALPRHRIAEMSRQVHAAGAYARDVVDRWMNGQDVNAEVAMPKNMAVAACNHAVDEAVQIHMAFRVGLGSAAGTTSLQSKVSCPLFIPSQFPWWDWA